MKELRPGRLENMPEHIEPLLTPKLFVEPVWQVIPAAQLLSRAEREEESGGEIVCASFRFEDSISFSQYLKEAIQFKSGILSGTHLSPPAFQS